MNYTVRLAHFAKFVTGLRVGGTLQFGDPIGTMGYTGLTDPDDVPEGTHVHVDVVKGELEGMYYLSDLVALGADRKELEAFTADLKALVDAKNPKITGDWLGYKDHRARDIAGDYPGHQPQIRWPLRVPGRILKIHRKDDNGYGLHIQIAYDPDAVPVPLEEIDMRNVQFNLDTNVRSAPSLSASVEAVYHPGETLNSAQYWGIAEKYLWLTYKADVNGKLVDRYIAFARDPWIQHER